MTYCDPHDGGRRVRNVKCICRAEKGVARTPTECWWYGPERVRRGSAKPTRVPTHEFRPSVIGKLIYSRSRRSGGNKKGAIKKVTGPGRIKSWKESKGHQGQKERINRRGIKNERFQGKRKRVMGLNRAALPRKASTTRRKRRMPQDSTKPSIYRKAVGFTALGGSEE